MTRIGEDVAETLQMIPSRFWVKRRIRGKWACRCCETITMAPVPAAPIDKAIAGTSVYANVIVSKYLDHQPLYRQEGIYARMGVPIARSTMAGWIGRIGVLFEPLTDLLAERITAASALQADETPVPVLDPGSGKTATGYLWAYRTLPSDLVQAVSFDFAMSRSQEHPRRMLAQFEGTLQVDGYAGYNETLRRANVIEAGCLAHYLERRIIWSRDRGRKQWYGRWGIVAPDKIHCFTATARTLAGPALVSRRSYAQGRCPIASRSSALRLVSSAGSS